MEKALRFINEEIKHLKSKIRLEEDYLKDEETGKPIPPSTWSVSMEASSKELKQYKEFLYDFEELLFTLRKKDVKTDKPVSEDANKFEVMLTFFQKFGFNNLGEVYGTLNPYEVKNLIQHREAIFKLLSKAQTVVPYPAEEKETVKESIPRKRKYFKEPKELPKYKICNECKKEKPIEDFYNMKQRNGDYIKDGKCKPCRSDYQKEWKKKNRLSH